MVDVVEEIAIARPSAAVWAVLADFGAISRWAPNVDHSCLTTEAGTGVGAVRRVQVGRNALLERVVEWEPGERISYEISGLPPVVRSVTSTWQLTGSAIWTTVTLTNRVNTGPRPPQVVAARVVGRMLAKTSRQMLDGLQAHVVRTAA